MPASNGPPQPHPPPCETPCTNPVATMLGGCHTSFPDATVARRFRQATDVAGPPGRERSLGRVKRQRRPRQGADACEATACYETRSSSGWWSPSVSSIGEL